MLKETLRIAPKETPLPQESNSQRYEPAKNFNNTLEFWNAAIVQETHLLKKPKRISEEMRLRNIEITGLYLEKPSVSQQIAPEYGLSRERIRQIIKDTILLLWDNSNPKTQNSHPKEGFSFRKPYSLTTRIRYSIRHGGTSAIIRDGLLKGSSIRQIQQHYGFTSDQIIRSRRILKGLGIEVPYLNQQTTFAENEMFAKQIREAEDFETAQSLLGKVNKGFLRKNCRGKNPLLFSLKKVAVEAGVKNKALTGTTQTLKRERIAVGKTPSHIKGNTTNFYHFIRAQDKSLAIEALKRQAS